MIGLIIPFIMNNQKLVAIFLIAIAVIAAGYYIYDEIGDAREEKIERAAVKTERKIQDEKDRIRNNRPDRAAVIVSLRDGSF